MSLINDKRVKVIFFKFYLSTYFFAILGLCCCTSFSLVVAFAIASLVAEHGL